MYGIDLTLCEHNPVFEIRQRLYVGMNVYWSNVDKSNNNITLYKHFDQHHNYAIVSIKVSIIEKINYSTNNHILITQHQVQSKMPWLENRGHNSIWMQQQNYSIDL